MSTARMEAVEKRSRTRRLIEPEPQQRSSTRSPEPPGSALDDVEHHLEPFFASGEVALLLGGSEMDHLRKRIRVQALFSG